MAAIHSGALATGSPTEKKKQKLLVSHLLKKFPPSHVHIYPTLVRVPSQINPFFQPLL
jgi:hypothetical protein